MKKAATSIIWIFGDQDMGKGLAIPELEIGPQHLNRSLTLHGGVPTSMLDTVCGFSCCYCPVPGHIRKAVTLSLTTSFTGQVSSGTVGLWATNALKAEGSMSPGLKCLTLQVKLSLLVKRQ